MKATLASLAIVLYASSLWCQDVPKAEVFGGYSYLRNVNGGGQGASGGVASAAYNFNTWLGIEGDILVHHQNQVYSCCSTYATATLPVTSTLYMVGPRVALRTGPLTAFAHVLAGGATSRTNAPSDMGGPFSSTQSAASAGAGVDLALRKWFAIRILEVDYVTNISGSPHTNNVGASAGIVFRFGGTAQARQRGVTSVQRETPPVANTGEAPLLGVVGYATDEGLKVTSVRPGSPAEKIFLKPGDVISKIDDKEVKNGRDIESAVAASTSGTIKVTGLDKAEIGGYGDMIQFERKIKVR